MDNDESTNVDVNVDDAAKVLLDSIETGARKKCLEGEATACWRLANFLMKTKKDEAAKILCECCTMTKHSSCCWESGT